YRMLDLDNKGGDAAKPLTLVLGPARKVEGQVTCEDTGKPLAGAKVVVWAQRYRGSGQAQHAGGTRTDDKGRYKDQPYGGNELEVEVHAPAESPYLGVRTEFEWPKGKERTECNVQLPRGVVVRGTLTEKSSGKGVAGARIEFLPERGGNLRNDIITSSGHRV